MNIFQQVFASVDPKAGELMRLSEENISTKRVSNNENRPNLNIPESDSGTFKSTSSNDQIRSKVVFSAMPAQPNHANGNKPDNKKSLKKDQPSTSFPLNQACQTKNTSKIATKSKAADKNASIIKKEINLKSEEKVFNIKETTEKIDNLDRRLEEMNEKILKMTEAYNEAQTANKELATQNSVLEMTLLKLKEAAKDANQRLIDLKNDFMDKEADNEESWEFRVNELLMECEVLRALKK